MKIYVGNLSYSVTDDDLVDAFSDFGDVASVNIVMDEATGQSKGYGFVEMQVKSEARDAVQVLNESPLCGRIIRVNEARGGGGGGNRNRRPRRNNNRNNNAPDNDAAKSAAKPQNTTPE